MLLDVLKGNDGTRKRIKNSQSNIRVTDKEIPFSFSFLSIFFLYYSYNIVKDREEKSN